MRKAFLLMVFMVFAFCNALNAQIKISGKVLTLEKNPLEYAEVALLSDKAIPLVSHITNENGEFVIDFKKGVYKLEIRQFKQVLYTKDIELNSDFDAGTITVDVTSILGTVTIYKKKELVERKIDRLVFNIENTISAVGGDALDALKITPGVSVRNENITIVGKQSIRVMVDDKILELGTEDLASFLRSIPADNIKNIEVITTPPAKYDAAGGSGLINIKLKKAQSDAWSLSLGSTYLRRYNEGEGAVTSNFMYSKNRLSLSSSFNYRDGGETFDYQDYNSFPDDIWNTKQVFNRKFKRFNGVLGMQYSATDHWMLGFQYIANLNKTHTNRPAKSSVFNYNNDIPFNEILSLNTAGQKPQFNSINLFNEFKLDSAGKKIILNLDYFNYANNDTRPYEGTSVMNNPYAIQYFKGINDNEQKTNNYSGKVDVELPTKFANWSTGAKVSVSNTANNISAFNSGLVNSPITSMPQTSHQFNYNEDVQALYFSGSKKLKNNLEAQIGLRMEATQTKSYNGNSNQSLSYNYAKLFPTVNLAYAPAGNSTYRFSYGRRIARPNFAELNPNVTYITQFLTIEGNQVLRPYFIDNFEFIYSYKKLESKLYYSIENDVFNQLGLPDVNTNRIRLIYKNIFNLKRYGFSESFTFDKISWWNSTNMLNVNYTTVQTIDSSAKGADGFTSFFTTNNDFTLNKAKTVSFNLGFDYYMSGAYGIDRIKPFTSTSVAIQYLLLNKDLRINLRANDIFRSDRFRFSSTVNGVHRSSNYYFDTRLFQLSVNYKFGSNKIDVKKRRTGNEEERARTGN
ncbi:TonB-dependent receptor [Pedobacter xixiisoli]|uniref:Outer membrane receptor proteins, mostly Fe transport n=1 Tax=Pedobacter xixiisoli TaxID=1476464 RepID=A0A285ZSN7_9SPHI|nr:TonB-dependent receptor [Pedobacter xixiisoli]SOD12658.1 Outer membrane receptor proteins, mostly Fe transport [Pedobacter xixiisoli]